jgi:proteic killer suppression protein
MLYLYPMIQSIRHKGLKLLWQKNDASKLPPAQVARIRLILTLLHSATVVGDMDFPGANLHPLKGDLAGHWSVTVSGNYRITFKFEDGDAYIVDHQDYH